MIFARRIAHAILGMFCTLMVVPVFGTDVYMCIDGYGHTTFSDKSLVSQCQRLVETWKGWVPAGSHSTRYKNRHINRRKHTPMINATARRYGLPESLVHAVIFIESVYDAGAVSRAGAVGLMQLMPQTAERYGVKNRRDPEQNVNGGMQYLRDLLAMFDNERLALAAYNAGENAVKKYQDIPPYPETQKYVKQVMYHYKKNLVAKK